jgi:hypothetical protein
VTHGRAGSPPPTFGTQKAAMAGEMENGETCCTRRQRRDRQHHRAQGPRQAGSFANICAMLADNRPAMAGKTGRDMSVARGPIKADAAGTIVSATVSALRWNEISEDPGAQNQGRPRTPSRAASDSDPEPDCRAS